ncbi:MAG: superoxide dismutase [Beijerinckiaceae bacterium]
MDRRTILSQGGLAIAAAGLSGKAFAQAPAPAAAPPAPPPFALPPLGYSYEALEPHIDTATMRVHHTGHHQAFITNLNNLAKDYADLSKLPAPQILSDLTVVPEAQRAGVRNNLGGHWNHTFFWAVMKPGGAKEPGPELKAALEAKFGNVANFVTAFNAAAAGRFGSGWAWLVVDKDKNLAVINTPYQDTPHMEGHRGAVIGIDVWEHAYYLKHQNRRADYLRAWWNVVNWDMANQNFKELMA